MLPPPPTSNDTARPSSRPWPVFASLSGYAARNLHRDLAAGLTLAAIAIPEQMATARLGGFPPEIGFFAFIAGAIAFAAFGANRFLSVGADSTITPIFAGGLAVLAAVGTPGYAGTGGGARARRRHHPDRRRRAPPGMDRGSPVGAGDHRLSRRHLACTSSSRSSPACSASRLPAAACCMIWPSSRASSTMQIPIPSRSASGCFA